MKITPSPPPVARPALPAPPPPAATTPPRPAAATRFMSVRPTAEPAPGAAIVRALGALADAAAEEGGRRMIVGAGLFGIVAAGAGIAHARARGERAATADWVSLGAHACGLCGASGLLRARPLAHGIVTAASGLLGAYGDALRDADRDAAPTTSAAVRQASVRD